MHQIAMFEKFKLRKDFKSLISGTYYQIIGFGAKNINNNYYQCWLIYGNEEKFLIPKITIDMLFLKNIIVKI